jgi:3-deoxy-D-manno-octulosonic-acid transferase
MTIVKPFTKKLKEREGMWEDLLDSLDKIPNNNEKRIWFHAASMGEFEQAKPIIELIKKSNPEIVIIVSFYSPSGYNNQKDYQYADAVLYMPFDTRMNASYFIKRINPDFAVFVRYEIWRNHLELLQKKKIPTYLICATKPNNPILYKNFLLRAFTKSNYNFYDKIYTISKEHSNFFKELNVQSNIQTLSDTRFDRIIENVEKAKNNKVLKDELFNDKDFILVAGSTWEPDETLILETVKILENENFIEKTDYHSIRLILVPHEPTKKHIKNLKKLLPDALLLSEIEQYFNSNPNENEIKNYLGGNHIIVDSIGKLLRLYANASAAYIGGAFGVGVHSVTEPAGYGIPLACGTRMTNSPDALNLMKIKGLEVVNNSEELANWLKRIISDKKEFTKISTINKQYLYDGLGSSKIISDEIMKNI